MKYFANYMADTVIRENEKGERFRKRIEHLRETGPVSKDIEEVWGIPTYGNYNELKPISKKDYDTFGIEWDWDPRTGKLRRFGGSK